MCSTYNFNFRIKRKVETKSFLGTISVWRLVINFPKTIWSSSLTDRKPYWLRYELLLCDKKEIKDYQTRSRWYIKTVMTSRQTKWHQINQMTYSDEVLLVKLFCLLKFSNLVENLINWRRFWEVSLLKDPTVLQYRYYYGKREILNPYIF